MTYKFDIRGKLKCKGVLQKEMNKRIQTITIISMFTYLLPICVVFLSSLNNSVTCKVCGFLIAWYFISIIVMSRSDGFDVLRDWVIFTMFFPVFFSLFITTYLFKIILKRKYPEMEEQHYNRWVKLQKLKRKLN